MTYRKVGFAVLTALLLVAMVAALGACGEAGDTGARDDSGEASPMPAATGEPLIFGFDAGFTGFMAMDVELAEKGILTKLDMIQNQWEGRPVEYKKADNGSDPVQAVDKARQLVESDGIQYMAGPIFSPATAAVTDYLAKAGGIPQCSIVGQPSDNLKTANGLAFMPNGLYGSQGYYFGKYVGEQLGYKTVNCVNLEDTAARQLQAGFEKGLDGERRRGRQRAVRADRHHRLQLVPHDAQGRRRHVLLGLRQRRRSVRQAVQRLRPHGPADRADGQQLQRAAARRPRAARRGHGGLRLLQPGDRQSRPTTAFVAAYQKLYPGEYPPPQAFGGYQAVELFLQGVKATGGDTTPATLIEAMSTITLDTPAGSVTMKPYQDAFIPVRDWYILETKEVDGRVAWVPIYTFEQVELGE